MSGILKNNPEYFVVLNIIFEEQNLNDQKAFGF